MSFKIFYLSISLGMIFIWHISVIGLLPNEFCTYFQKFFFFFLFLLVFKTFLKKRLKAQIYMYLSVILFFFVSVANPGWITEDNLPTVMNSFPYDNILYSVVVKCPVCNMVRFVFIYIYV